MLSEEAKTALATLARIGGGAVLGACAGTLAGLAIGAIVIARVPELGIGRVMYAFVGNGATFGAIAGSVIVPIVVAGPLSTVRVRRWAPAAVIVSALCADGGLLLGNFLERRAAAGSDGSATVFAVSPQAGGAEWMPFILPSSPEIGILFAMIFGIAGFVVFSLVVGARESAGRRRALQARR